MKNTLDGGEALLEAFRRLEVDYIVSSRAPNGRRCGKRWRTRSSSRARTAWRTWSGSLETSTERRRPSCDRRRSETNRQPP